MQDSLLTGSSPSAALNTIEQPRPYMKPILGLVAVTRLSMVWFVMLHDPRAWLFKYPLDMIHLARALLAGRGLSSTFGGSTGPSAFLAPGYPVLLAAIFRVFGDCSTASAAVIMLLQTLVAVMTGWVMMHIAHREIGARTANVAGIFWALGLPLIWMPTLLWETSLSTLLLVAFVALALHCRREPSRNVWLIMGAYCALALLVNPSLLLAMFAIGGWTAYQTRTASRVNPCLGLLVMLAVFSPWPIRNARALHAFIPLRSNLGFELWQGNRPGADGFFDKDLDLLHSRQEFDEYAADGEVAYMRNKTALAKAFIRTHPLRFTQLTAKRIACYWTGVESPPNLLLVVHTTLSTVLGLIGLLLLARSRPSLALLVLLPLLLFPLPYYVTHPDQRFRGVLDPIALTLAGYAFVRCDEWMKRRQAARMRQVSSI